MHTPLHHIPLFQHPFILCTLIASLCSPSHLPLLFVSLLDQGLYVVIILICVISKGYVLSACYLFVELLSFVLVEFARHVRLFHSRSLHHIFTQQTLPLILVLHLFFLHPGSRFLPTQHVYACARLSRAVGVTVQLVSVCPATFTITTNRQLCPILPSIDADRG